MRVGAGVEVGELEGLGNAELVTVGEALRDGVGVDVEAAPHPAASIPASASVATFQGITSSDDIVTLLARLGPKVPA